MPHPLPEEVLHGVGRIVSPSIFKPIRSQASHIEDPQGLLDQTFVRKPRRPLNRQGDDLLRLLQFLLAGLIEKGDAELSEVPVDPEIVYRRHEVPILEAGVVKRTEGDPGLDIILECFHLSCQDTVKIPISVPDRP